MLSSLSLIFPTHQLHPPLLSALPSSLLFCLPLSIFLHLCPPSPLLHPRNTSCIFKSVSPGGRGRAAPTEEVVLPHLIAYVSDTFPLRWQPLEAQDEPFNKIKEMVLIAIDHGSTNEIASATASLKGLNEKSS